MKKYLFITLLAILSASPAYAMGGNGGGHSGGHGSYGGFWGGGWIVPALIGGAIVNDLTYPYPQYAQPYPLYNPYQVYAQPSPVYQLAPVYAQPSPAYAPSAPPSEPVWYFCKASNGYYPYVSSCPSGWQTVPVTPPVAMQNLPPPPPR